MSAAKREITRADILPMAEYGKIRTEKRKEYVALKKQRRIEVGPFATVLFESYTSMWLQVHEMLYIEKGGEEQIEGELAAYNPMIPNGRELTCTVLFEIDDPIRRKNVLGRIGGVEETMTVSFAGEVVRGVPEEDTDRTSGDGKASSVQFIHFPFTAAQAALFKQPGTQVLVGFTHENYGHMAVMPEAMRASLASDLD
ncbi:MAG: DUF3501 family protein [Alphaproteobacteria bacterium]|nr:MAG: DUF3501 family protein [Alphaproteobacteria bacterium]